MDETKRDAAEKPRKSDPKPSPNEEKAPIAIEEPIEPGDPDAQPV